MAVAFIAGVLCVLMYMTRVYVICDETFFKVDVAAALTVDEAAALTVDDAA